MLLPVKFQTLIKDTLAMLGGIFTLIALFEPWITEEYHILRFKSLISIVFIFLTFRFAMLYRKKAYSYILFVTSGIGLLFFWLLIPTFPLNLLAWTPTMQDRELLRHNNNLKAIDAYKLGIIELLDNNQEQAYIAFTEANKDERLRPYSIDRLAYLERIQGNDLKSLGLYEEAFRWANKAELKSERKRLLSYNWQNRGFLYRRLAFQAKVSNIKKWDSLQKKALESFQYSLEYDPKFHKSWYMIGQVHYDRGELNAAREAYFKAYFLNPQYDRAAYNLACIDADLGNNKESLAWVKRALQINASQAYAMEKDESFKKLKKTSAFNDIITDAKERLEVVYRANQATHD